MCAVDWGGGGGEGGALLSTWVRAHLGGLSTLGDIRSTVGVTMEFIGGVQYNGGLS